MAWGDVNDGSRAGCLCRLFCFNISDDFINYRTDVMIRGRAPFESCNVIKCCSNVFASYLFYL